MSLKMDKIEYRAVIKFFVKEGLTPNEIHSNFIKVYGGSYTSFSTIKKWAAEFNPLNAELNPICCLLALLGAHHFLHVSRIRVKRGRTSLEDDPREGRSKSATTPEIVEHLHGMVLDDRRMKVREIAETIGISKERVGYILHEELDMKRLCARWVPRLLTADQKRTRMKICEQCLERFNENKTDFVRRFVTMDETWIHHYTAVKTVDRSRLFSAKEDKVGSISRKGHGIGVLVC